MSEVYAHDETGSEIDSVFEEVAAAGVAVAFWAWKLFGLDDEQRRERFIHQGRLDLPQER